MLLAAHGVLDRTEIIATDISERALKLARSGVFRPRSLRQSIASEAERWLHISEGRPVLSAEILSAVKFSKLNLMDSAAIAGLGRFDVILCRNVLIYFSDDTITKLIADLAAALNPDGVVLIGTCESLLRFSTQLNCEERSGTFLYRNSA
jgi:chemotaxis protein methyltransferase CheR